MTQEPEPEQKSVNKIINKTDLLLFTKLMEMIRIQGEVVQIIMERFLYGDKKE